MATLTQDKVREIIQNSPMGTDPREVVNGLVERGHILEGYEGESQSTQSIREQSPRRVEVTDFEGLSPQEIEVLQKAKGVTPPEVPEEKGAIAGIGEDIRETGVGIAEAAERGQEQFQEIIRATKAGEQTPLEALFQGAGTAARTGARVVGETVIGAAKALVPEAVEEIPGKAVRGIGEFGAGLIASLTRPGEGIEGKERVKQDIAQQFSELSQDIEEFKQTNPRAARNIGALLGFGEAALEAAGVAPAKKLAKVGKEAVEEVATKGKRIVGAELEKAGVAAEVGIAREVTEAAAKRAALIEEKIAPGLTAKETRKAISEGRVTRGKEGRLFGKKPDVVEQSEAVKRSAATIERRIPNAEKLDDLTLNDTLKTEISTISEELRPQLQASKVTPATKTKVTGSWDELKKKQIDDPDFSDFGGKAMQGKFENRLSQVDKSDNLDDLWNIRKEYDDSIPSRVKEANAQSDGRLQFQKETWLDNRRILNDSINDAATGLGGTSKGAFDDMSDLYRARQNIIGKSKVDIKGAPGAISPQTLIKRGIQAAAGAIGLKFLID